MVDVERRTGVRHELRSMVYVAVGTDNGGIAVDLGEAGIGVQTVASLIPQSVVSLAFDLAQQDTGIIGTAEVVWATKEGRAGLSFLDVSDVARQQIRDYLSTQSGEVVVPSLARRTEDLVRAGPDLPPPSGSAPDRAYVPPTLDSVSPAEPIPLGPFLLADEEIDHRTSDGRWAVYLLGNVEEGQFRLFRIGRSRELGDDLKGYIGDYGRFKFIYCGSGKKAFDSECVLYHQHRPAHNKFHPRRPPESDWQCPVCHGF